MFQVSGLSVQVPNEESTGLKVVPARPASDTASVPALSPDSLRRLNSILSNSGQLEEWAKNNLRFRNPVVIAYLPDSRGNSLPLISFRDKFGPKTEIVLTSEGKLERSTFFTLREIAKTTTKEFPLLGAALQVWDGAAESVAVKLPDRSYELVPVQSILCGLLGCERDEVVFSVKKNVSPNQGKQKTSLLIKAKMQESKGSSGSVDILFTPPDEWAFSNSDLKHSTDG